MRYYAMCHEFLENGYTDGEVKFSPALNHYYGLGEEINLGSLSVVVELDTRIRKMKTDFFLTGCGAFFVSKDFKLAIETLNSDLEFVKAEVNLHHGVAVDKDYYFAHCKKMYSCFDYFDSEYSGKTLFLEKLKRAECVAESKVRGIKKFCIDESKVGPLDLFFVDNVVWIDPIVSENLVNLVKLRRLFVRFIPLDSAEIC